MEIQALESLDCSGRTRKLGLLFLIRHGLVDQSLPVLLVLVAMRGLTFLVVQGVISLGLTIKLPKRGLVSTPNYQRYARGTLMYG